MTDKPLKAGLVDRTEFSDEFTENLPLSNGELLYAEVFPDRLEVRPAGSIFEADVAHATEPVVEVGSEQVICDDCSQVFKAEDYGGDIGRAKKARAAHSQMHTEEDSDVQQVICDDCDRVFKAEDYDGSISRAKRALNSHARVHVKEGNEQEGEEGNEERRGLDELFPE